MTLRVVVLRWACVVLWSFMGGAGCREPSPTEAETLRLRVGQSRKEIVAQLTRRFPEMKWTPHVATFMKKPWDGFDLSGRHFGGPLLLVCFDGWNDPSDDDKAGGFGFLHEVDKVACIGFFTVEPATERNLSEAWMVYEKGSEIEGGDTYDMLYSGGENITGVASELHFPMHQPEERHTKFMCTFDSRGRIERMFFSSVSAAGVDVRPDGRFSLIYDKPGSGEPGAR